MNIVFNSSNYCTGKLLLASELKNYTTIIGEIVYVNNENMFSIKEWYSYKPLCILIDISTVFSHLVSYFISLGVSVVCVEESEIKNLYNQNITIDFVNNNISKTSINIIKSLENSKSSFVSSINSTRTADGYTVNLYASIKNIDNAIQSKEIGINNAGLICTEYFYLKKDKSYFAKSMSKICSYFKNGFAAIRLFDCEPNKVVFNSSEELTCCRGRHSLENETIREIIEHQIKQIIYLSKKYDVKVVIPYVESIRDLEEIDKIIKKHNNGKSLPMCAMIETVAAFNNVSSLLKFCDSFAIGSNDLLSAFFSFERDVIRKNANITPYSKSFFNYLSTYDKQCIAQTRICGQLPLFPFMLEVLLSLGFRNFTVPTPMISTISNRINKIKTIPSNVFLENIQKCDSENEIIECMSNLFA